ncbi:hypothetical protein AAHA92_14550 [Salvia divinorum]|uniref:NB-ARC domain-containing protein n=1 Tax=Salvia divinorum TaxID=28513 RepID=A0ABD1HBY1_SALDI
MAAAYAALVSLTHVLHQILHPPPLNQIIIPRDQIESLQHKVCFLLDSLQTHSREEGIQDLEKKIAEAAYAAEDILESHVVTQIRDKYPIHRAESSALSHQYCGLNGVKGLHAMVRKLGKINYKNEIPRVIKKFQSIEKEVVRIIDKKGIEGLNSSNSHLATSSPRPPSSREEAMVGFNEQLLQVMSAITTYELNRLIIPIVGMGGIVDFYSIDEILHLINTRYVACAMDMSLRNFSLWKSISRLWNLETLVIDREVFLPPQFWQMAQLRHLKMERIILNDPPNSQMDDQSFVVLENLQTLSTVLNFRCTDQIIQRIPNLKKLRVTYGYRTNGFGTHDLCNLVHLDRLESLGIRGHEKLSGNIDFPGSLRKLTLENCFIPWEDMSMIGLLPNLEVLKLRTNAAKGQEWNPVEGEFCRLKFLLVHGCELEIWEAEHTHFPVLQHLHLRRLKLKEIPMAFAEILTLRVIDLNYCSSSLEISAEKISEERESLGYDDFQLRLNPSEISWSQENVVGFEDEADTLIRYLNEESEKLEVISITGMPGFGKTTLAWKIYQDPRIQYKFSTLIWVNVSQEFNMKKVFLTILERFTELDMSVLTEGELAQKVQFYLERQNFLLFMDDVWTAEIWKTIENSLPKSNRMGKVVITSRDEKVARQANHLREPHKLRVQDSKESWELLQLKVFGKLDECPQELDEIGSIIAKQCEGIPLAIIVIAGILVEKYPKTSDMKIQWENISASLSMYFKYDNIVENIIALSYDQLPTNLRDCFLYLVLKKCKELEEIPFVLVKSLEILEIDHVSESVVAIARKMELEKQGQLRAKSDRFKLIINPNAE